MPAPSLAAHPFDPRFVERSPLFWPIARAARALLDPLGPSTAFPPVESFDRVFDGAGHEPPVRFVLAAPRPRRRGRRDPVDPGALYDARITLEGLVPTRHGSWHDLMNALVWGTFPRAKKALHARQHRAISERIVPGARTLPSARTRELDALALLDEGGVVLPAGQVQATRAVVFGHAIYESLALGIPPAVVAAIDLDFDARRAGNPNEAAAVLGAVDEALARAVEDASRLGTPDELRRVELVARP